MDSLSVSPTVEDYAVWGIDGGLALIRAIQPSIKFLGFHVALAGGVLNVGSSLKDLDLVFLPLTNDKAPETEPLINYLRSLFGRTHDDGDEDTGVMSSHKPNPYTPYREQRMFPNNGHRVDVFIA